MKILPVEKIREADSYTIENEPITDLDLMERAASKCFEWLVTHLQDHRPVKVFTGTGNNGGDGLAIARMLYRKGFICDIWITGTPDQMSPSCLINYKRLKRLKGLTMNILSPKSPFPDLHHDETVIDALFGSGLSRPVTGFHANLIQHINYSNCQVISIDVPSGFLIDTTNYGKTDPVIIRAHHTLTFLPPKIGFLFPENGKFVGNWHGLDIGISREFIDNTNVRNHLITKEDVAPLLHKRGKFDHKGTFGHALLICGGQGKAGAAVLAARACLRSGPGLVTVRVPTSGINILQTAVPEAMCSIDPDDAVFSSIPDLSPYSSIAVGPGIGVSDKTAHALKLLIQNSAVPLILDADALNILGQNKTWLRFLPRGSILTPHFREFERLTGKAQNDFHRNELQRELSFKCQVYIVLKGAHTTITAPNGSCLFNSTGNPGMATGGSGDVLTGILAGLMAQKYGSLEASLLAVYLHGVAGDLATIQMGQEALIAGDIVNNLGNAFIHLYGKL